MRFERPTLREVAVIAAMILAFVVFGARAGLRLVAVVLLVESIRSLREPRVGVGIEGYEPSFYLTGRAALVARVLGIVLALVVLLFPEVFLR